MKRELNALLTIAFRDFTKLLRDKTRIFVSLILPIIFIGVLGGSFEANIGSAVGFNFQHFIWVGIFGSTLFQSTASGIISLIRDRESDFSQEIFVSPISRYTIIAGKILGETMVSFVQILAIILLGFFLQVPLTVVLVLMMLAAGFLAALLGGAFGVIVLANVGNQRSANQLVPFIIFPQLFLSGAFTPVEQLPFSLLILSRLAPMTYAVDIVRNAYYMGKPEYDKVVLYNPWVDIAVIMGMILVFISIGTYLFVRNERNR